MVGRCKIEVDAAEENRALYAFTSVKVNTGVHKCFILYLQVIRRRECKENSKSKGSVKPKPPQNIQILSATLTNDHSESKKSERNQRCC